MQFYYVDSSVLVKRHVNESGSQWFRNLVLHRTENAVVSSQISEVEVYSALARRMHATDLEKEQYRDLVADFNYVRATEYVMMEVSDAVIDQARHLLERHPLRAYDVVQLASAQLASTKLNNDEMQLTFLSGDKRLLNAADLEGLPIINPDMVE